MRSHKVFWVCACLLAFAVVPLAAKDDQGPAWLFVGPRVGVTGVATTWRFDSQMQEIRSRDLEYFPVYSQVGFAVQQRITLDDKGTALVFRELALVGGIDQNLALFSGTLLGGIAIGALELSIGPEVSLDASQADKDNDPETVASLALGVTWVFKAWGRPLPVSVVVVPLWGEWEPRITALVGLDFPIRTWKTEEKLPFNY